MKAIVKSLLVALTALLATAQRGVEFSYEGIIVDATTRYLQQAGEENAFRPLLRALQVETVSPAEPVDKPVVFRKLTFPLDETVCERAEEQTDKQCPLKRNGKSYLCTVEISQSALESSTPMSTGITCEPMSTEDQLQHKVRVRRGKAGGNKGSSGGNKGSSGGNKGNKGSSGGKRGGGSRPGGGSSIAGGGRGGGSTRTA